VKKSLTFTEELNLRLAKGKNYKAEPIIEEEG
jgi:hypothetical protein